MKPVSFDDCTRFNNKPVVEEELRLVMTSDGGQPSVGVDAYGGVGCLLADGTSSGAIP